jgi:hypothetical protein
MAAQRGGSEPEQQAAIEHLRQVQAAQTERLKQIAAHSQSRIATLEMMKQ